MTLAELSRLTENVVRIGTVISVDHANATCRVMSGELTTNNLAWLSLRAGTTKQWSPPTEGEQCLLLSPSGETANGIVLVGLFSVANQAPSNNPDEIVTTMPDGASFVYNHKTSKLTIDGIKTLLVKAADEMTFDCPKVKFTGEVEVAKLLTYLNGLVGKKGTATNTAEIDGDIIVNGVGFINHVHPENDGGNTLRPVGYN